MKHMSWRMGCAMLAVIFVFSFWPGQPEGEANSKIEKLRGEQKSLEQAANRVSQRMAAGERAAGQLEQEIATLNSQLVISREDLNRIEANIVQIQEELFQIETKIEQTNENLRLTHEQLEAAMLRIETRTSYMESRLRFMYVNGGVTYLDVLLGSSTFGDLLNRMGALKQIIDQDKDILEQNRKDHEMLDGIRASITFDLNELDGLLDEHQAKREQMLMEKGKQQVMIAQLETKREETSELSEEMEAEMLALARDAAVVQANLARAKAELAHELEVDRQKREAEARARAAAQYTGGQMEWPVPSSHRITSGFGNRINPITGRNTQMHHGVDIGAPTGTKIVAAASGTVIIAQAMSGYGNTVIIDHGRGIWTLYAHIRLNGFKVRAGDHVNRGDHIADVGMTGTATGPHLHFEVRVNERAVNPMPYLQSQ